MKTFLDELSAFAGSVWEQEHKLFPSPLHWLGLANGDADFHDNVIFFGFDERHHDPVLVAKVPRLVENGWMLETEYDHLMELWKCIGMEAAHYVPRPYALTSVGERLVLLISYVTGESLTRLSRKSFWGNPLKVATLAKDAAQTLRELNRLTERAIQHEEAGNVNLQTKVDKFKELFQLTAEEDHALTELVQTVEQASKKASREVMVQGDFWHGNMIHDRRQGRLRFVDWQFAHWSTDVSVDIYFFLLAAALAAAEAGSVQERARSAFRLLHDWHTDVIPAYLAAYGQPDHYVLLPQRFGMLLCCVEKATRSALEFGYHHPDDLMWRYLFAELLQWPAENQ